MISLFFIVLIHLGVGFALSLFSFGSEGVQLAIDPVLGAALITGGAGLLGGLGGTQTATAGNIALETPEQKAARQKLLGFAETGVFGEFEAGAEVPLEFGQFDPTGAEATGLTKLDELLAADLPEEFQLGREALRDVLETDPAKIEAQFDPFKARARREIKEAEDALKRGAGFASNLFSSDTISKLGDVQTRGAEVLTSELARLVNEQANRRAAAIPTAFLAGEARQAQEFAEIEASQRFGSLTRLLNTQAKQLRDAEVLRRRGELLLPIEAAKAVAGAPTFGAAPQTVTRSPFQDLLNLTGQIGGQFLSNELFKRQFPSVTPTAPQPTTVRA